MLVPRHKAGIHGRSRWENRGNFVAFPLRYWVIWGSQVPRQAVLGPPPSFNRCRFPPGNVTSFKHLARPQCGRSCWLFAAAPSCLERSEYVGYRSPKEVWLRRLQRFPSEQALQARQCREAKSWGHGKNTDGIGYVNGLEGAILSCKATVSFLLVAVVSARRSALEHPERWASLVAIHDVDRSRACNHSTIEQIIFRHR